MLRLCHVVGAALLIAGVAAPPAGAQEVQGNWTVSYVANGNFEQVLGIVKIEAKDGKASGAMVAASPRIKGLTLKSVGQEGQALRIVFTTGAVDVVCETRLPAGGAQRVLGAVAIDANVFPAWIAKTELTELDAKSSGGIVHCPPMQQARILTNKALQLRFKAQQTKDPEQRKEILKQAAAADEAARKEAPRLYREVLAKHADSPAVFEAVLSLVRQAQAQEYKQDEVKTWAMTAANAAKAYGARLQADINAQLAGALVTQEGFAPLAVEYARHAEKALTPTSAAAEQARILGLLTRALRKAGNEDEAKTFDARIAKIDATLDREYLAKMPPFKGEPFAGRKSKSERAVFFELFTGAACPPCVAADLAFDVLTKTYKPGELVLIQYHVHIPGPDPLTNPDTEARWKYYGAAVRGVPASLFNGKAAAGGGGGVANAEKKYDQYREVIDPLLEERAFARLSAHAKQTGDRVDINVEVTDLAGPGSDKKLRILLAEETIRYAGPNKIRFHHNVVRAMPGGTQGQSLLAAASKHKASIDLAELRGRLNKYLDNYQANVRPFANPARPLEFANLRVIAFVQDDATREILQAVQVEVEGGKNGK